MRDDLVAHQHGLDHTVSGEAGPLLARRSCEQKPEQSHADWKPRERSRGAFDHRWQPRRDVFARHQPLVERRGGAKQEKTEWHRCVVWNTKSSQLADIVERYVKKGDKLYVEGRIEYRQWQDKEGQTRYSTEINVRELIMLGGGAVVAEAETSTPIRRATRAAPPRRQSAGGRRRRGRFRGLPERPGRRGRRSAVLSGASIQTGNRQSTSDHRRPISHLIRARRFWRCDPRHLRTGKVSNGGPSSVSRSPPNRPCRRGWCRLPP